MLFPAKDAYIGRSLAVYGEYSEGEIDVFRQLVKPGSIVLEAGSNIGAHTLFFAQAVGLQGRVHAFEPQRVLFQLLCGNLALNGIRNTFAYQTALSDRPGSLAVPRLDYDAAGNFGGVSLKHGEGERVPVTTVDALALPRLTLLKADVEGMEHALLRGAAETIRRCRPVLYVENDRGDRSEALIELIRSFGYRLWWHLPPLFRPGNFRGRPDDVLGNIISINMLCLPAEANSRISGMPEVTGPDWRATV